MSDIDVDAYLESERMRCQEPVRKPEPDEEADISWPPPDRPWVQSEAEKLVDAELYDEPGPHKVKDVR